MNETPRPRESILRFTTSEADKAAASAYLQEHGALLDAVLACESAMDVREKVLGHFDLSTEIAVDKRPLMSTLQKAVLVEAVDRWNKKRISESR